MRQHRLATCVGTAIVLLPVLLHAGSGVGSVSYRGPSRNGVFPEAGLMREWPERGPELVWRFGNLGPSWASVVVAGETVYVPGGGSVGKLFAFTLDGRLKWAKKYGPEFSVRYQGARGTPIVTDRFVIVTSGLAVIYCMDAATGESVWEVDTVKRFNNQVPGWGYNLTPILVGQKIILPIRRGDCTMAALDIATGDTVWVNRPSEYAIGDSSPVLVEHGRTRLVVNNLWHAIIAVDPDTGTIVWELAGDEKAGTMVTPVFNEGYLLADWDGKTVMFRPTRDGKAFDALWEMPRISGASQAVILDGKVFSFGQLPSDRALRGRGRWARVALQCHDAETGKLLQQEAAGGGPGSVVAADGMLYWQIDGPKLVLARVTKGGFEIVSSFQPQWGDKDMWIHPVIAEGRLFYRSDCAQGGDRLKAGGKLAVYDLRADQLPALRQRRREMDGLVQRLDAKSPDDRADAADQLGQMGYRARLAVPALAEVLTDQDATVRRQAAAALSAIGAEAVPALVSSLQDERVWKDGHAASALIEITPDATDLTSALLDAVEANPAVREDVGPLVERIGPEAAPSINRLLLSDDRHVRWWAVDLLREFGPGAEVAVPNLVTVIETRDQWFRANAARTLGAIGAKAAETAEAVRVLVDLTEDEFTDARAAAAEALGKLASKDDKVIDALKRLLRDDKEEVAAAASKALKELAQD